MAEQVITGTFDETKRDAFLSRPIIARIATVSPDTCHPHVVPVWFLWDGASLWISSYRTTRKSRELSVNPYCSVVIDEAQDGLNYQAVLMEGKAELIDQPADLVKEMLTRIYTLYLGPTGVLASSPQEWIKDPENQLIKLTPRKPISWYSRTEPES